MVTLSKMGITPLLKIWSISNSMQNCSLPVSKIRASSFFLLQPMEIRIGSGDDNPLSNELAMNLKTGLRRLLYTKM